MDKAEDWLKKSIQIKAYADTYRELAFIYLVNGRNQEALKLIPLLIGIDSSNTRNYESAGLIALMSGNNVLSRKYFQKSIELNKSIATDVSAFAPIGLGMYLMKENKKEDAEIFLSRSLSLNLDYIKNKKSQDDDDRIHISSIYAIQGEKKKSLEWLQKAIDVNWVDVELVEKNPWFDNIKKEPKYKEMIKLVKEKVAEMRIKAEEY